MLREKLLLWLVSRLEDEYAENLVEDHYHPEIAGPLQGLVRELVADALSGVFSFFRASEPIIHIVAPDMRHYWNPESAFGSDVRYPMIRPLKEAMDRDDTILVIAHSLGTMISYDTFWKFSRTGEYRPEYSEKQIDLFITIGSPLGDDTVKSNLKGTNARRERRYPSNIDSLAKRPV